MPFLDHVSTTGSGIGAVRRVEGPGLLALEKLEVSDEACHLTSYLIMDAEGTPFPGNLYGNIQLEAMGDKTKVNWWGDAEDGTTQAAQGMKLLMGPCISSGMGGLHKAMERSDQREA